MTSIPKFHDGLLMGVEILGDEEVVLRLKDVENRNFRLRLLRVSLLKVDDFRQGNIILDVTVSERLEDQREIIAWLAFSGTESDDPEVRRYIEEAVKNHWKLVTVAPSYGAEVFALCADIELVEDVIGGKEL